MRGAVVRLSAGNRIRVRLAGTSDDWCYGIVVLAEGSSVAIAFDGLLRCSGGYIGKVLPVTADYEAETATAIWGDEYEIEVAGETQEAQV